MYAGECRRDTERVLKWSFTFTRHESHRMEYIYGPEVSSPACCGFSAGDGQGLHCPFTVRLQGDVTWLEATARDTQSLPSDQLLIKLAEQFL